MRHSTSILTLSLLALLALPAAPAAAQEAWRADEHGVVITAERMFGVHLNVATTEYPDRVGDATASTFMANFLWGSSVGSESVNLYAMPFIGIHGVIGPGLTVGGSVGFFSHTGELDQDLGNVETPSVDLPSQFGFMFAPRFGAILPVNGIVSFWPRGGVTLYNVSTTIPQSGVTDEFTISDFGVALSIDPMLVITPAPHVGLLIGPTIDIGLGGSVDTDQGDGDDIADEDNPTVRQSNFGLVFGLAVFL